MAVKAGWAERKLLLKYMAFDMRATKDKYRDEHERIFGKRDIKHHAKRSGTRIYKFLNSGVP